MLYKKMKQLFIYMIPSFITGVILFSVFYLYGLYPFGNKTLAWCDMKQQVIPLLLQLKELFSGSQSLFFQTLNAGGSNFWGIFFFFISSPFSFLMIWIDTADSVLMMNLIVLFKMVLSAFFAMMMFYKIFPNLDLIPASGLSVLYALSGFPLMFYQNLVWLDIVCIFPLLIMGIYSMIYENKVAMYSFSLACLLIVNYYMSYMVVLFLILCFGIFMFTPRKKGIHLTGEYKNNLAGRLAFGTFFSAITTCFIWLPSFMQYLNSARVISLTGSLSSGHFLTYYETTLAVLFTTAPLTAILFFVLIPKNKKIVPPVNLLILFLLLLVPLLIEPVNKMWHTGSYQAFPVRFGYIMTMCGLIILASYFSQTSIFSDNNSDIKRQRNIIPFFCVAGTASAMIGTALLLHFYEDEMDSFTTTLWNDFKTFLFLAIVFILYSFLHIMILLLKHYEKISKKVFVLCFCGLLLMESFFNTSVYIGFAANDADYYHSIFDLKDRVEDPSEYRVKMENKYFDVNLTGGLGYSSLSTYTSLTSEDYMYFMKKMGFSSYWMEINSSQGTLFSDAFLGNKYTIARNDTADDGKEIVYQNEEYKILENPDVMKLASVLSVKDLNGIKDFLETNRFEIHNWFFQKLTNRNENLFYKYLASELDNLIVRDENSRISVEKDSPLHDSYLRYNIDVINKKAFYFDCFDTVSNKIEEAVNDSFQIYVNGIEIENSYPNTNVNGLLYLGTFENQSIQIEVKLLKNVSANSFGVAGLDIPLMQNAIRSLNTRNESVSMKQKNNSFVIDTIINESENESDDGLTTYDSYLLVSIPFDKGFHAVVNRKNVKIERVFHDLVAIPLVQGKNHIVLTFIPNGFIPGVLISLIGGLIGIIVWKKRKFLANKRFFSIIPKGMKLGFYLLFCIVIIAVYIFPVLVYFLF